MITTIKNLTESTRNMELKIFEVYVTKDGITTPELGIRDEMNTGVVIDGIWWIIAGKALNGSKHITTIDEFISANTPHIVLEAQAVIHGAIVNVNLGKKSIVSKSIIDGNTVVVEIL